ncbi:distal tail protein Dit [Lactococcus cremoris]|uniref:distal tail protein Dit n=2 Tax=Lactococcus lactis subsp. cremoris TaxID=1359 RepID=UPI0021F9A866|nr:distal tail protein Dit [Lactococcus cremoris]UXV60027.1 phage tail family protein [Lactococcus cremoris]
MAFSVKFNDVDLSTIVDGFTAITRNIGAGWTNTVQHNPIIGADFTQNSINSKSITVNFIANVKLDRFTSVRKSLASALNVKQPAALIFDDDPNQVWWAVPDGTPTLDESSFYQAVGSITFLVPSGVSESVETNILNASNSGGSLGTITNNSDGSVDVEINNTGNLEAFPTIEITNVHENGYIAIPGQNGAIEIGKRQEADGATSPMSENLYFSTSDTNFSHFKDVAPGTPNPQNNWLATNGKLEFQKDGLRLKDKGTVGSKQGVAGGMKVMTLPADSNGHVGAVNFYSYFNIFAWAGAFGQTGVLQVLFTDINDKLVAGYGITKGDMSGNEASMKCWVGGNSPREYASNNFISNNGEGNGAGSMNNISFNEKTGHSDFVKTGSQLKFYWKGSRIEAIVPELETVEIAKVYIYIGQYVQSNKFMTNLSLRNIWFRKDNVDVWHNIPNRYATGSKIIVNMNGKDTVVINGMPAIQEKIRGTEPFSIPPGRSTLKILQSTWNTTPPIVQISYKERNL